MTQAAMTRSSENDVVNAVSLFSGLGGIDIGLHRAGVRTVACVEKNDAAAKTLKVNSRNHSEMPETRHVRVQKKYPWKVIHEDIRELEPNDILQETRFTEEKIDLVVGGPPCQTFSRSNEGSRQGIETDRGKLYQEYARILHELEPEAFIFENVRGLKSSNNGKDLQKIRDALEGDTYNTIVQVLNAADYGIPQTRKRLFIIGSKNHEPEFPSPSHTENGNNETEEWVTTGEALQGFDIDQEIEEIGGYSNAIGSKYGPLLQDIPEGANYQHFSQRKYDPESEEYVQRNEDELDEKVFDWRTRHWNYLLKLDRDRPSWTLQAEPGTTVGPFHWRARKLSLLEQMELMDLPRDYYISGSTSQIQKQIGNAVPPGLAETVTRQLLKTTGLEHRAKHSEPEKPVEREEKNEQATNFKVEVQPDKSPWKHAGQVLQTLQQEEAVVVEAEKQAIPTAIDTLEITRRQTSKKLQIDVTEEVDHTADGINSKISQIKATVTTGQIQIPATNQPRANT